MRSLKLKVNEKNKFTLIRNESSNNEDFLIESTKKMVLFSLKQISDKFYQLTELHYNKSSNEVILTGRKITYGYFQDIELYVNTKFFKSEDIKVIEYSFDGYSHTQEVRSNKVQVKYQTVYTVKPIDFESTSVYEYIANCIKADFNLSSLVKVGV